MHPSSMRQVSKFVQKYLDPNKKLAIIEIGSCSDQTYRPLFESPNWTYVGADLKGQPPQVDLILSTPYSYSNIQDKSYDVVVSGQVLEHIEDMYAWILELKRILRTGGLICIIAPWSWEQHDSPDCWRILPDGMKFLLAKVAGFKLLEVYKQENDCVGIAQK